MRPSFNVRVRSAPLERRARLADALAKRDRQSGENEQRPAGLERDVQLEPVSHQPLFKKTGNERPETHKKKSGERDGAVREETFSFQPRRPRDGAFHVTSDVKVHENRAPTEVVVRLSRNGAHRVRDARQG